MHTVCHSWDRSSFTEPVDIWLIALMENLTEFPAVFQKGTGKGKWHLFQSRGNTFWPRSSRLSVTGKSNQEGECQHISNGSIISYGTTVVFCIQFMWQSSNCKTAEPAGKPPSQHIWTIWHCDNREPQGHISQQHGKCVFEHSGAEDRTASEGSREKSGVTFYWLISINNQMQAAEKAVFTEDKACRKCCYSYGSIKQKKNKTKTYCSFLQAINCSIINSSESSHLNFIRKVISAEMCLGCLSSVFWSWQGPDSSQADVGQMLHLTATVWSFQSC